MSEREKESVSEREREVLTHIIHTLSPGCVRETERERERERVCVCVCERERGPPPYGPYSVV